MQLMYNSETQISFELENLRVYLRSNYIKSYLFTKRSQTRVENDYKTDNVADSQAMPWSYRTETGTWEGFCIDLIDVLAERMDFDYELVVSEEEDTMPLINETSPEGIISNLVNGVSVGLECSLSSVGDIACSN